MPRAKEALYKAQQEAYSLTGQAMDRERVCAGGPGDRTQAAALRVLEAENRLKEAESWADVFTLLDKAFPASTPEGRVADYLYARLMTQKDVCRALGFDRQTVRRRRDSLITHAALFAASKGLISITEEDCLNEREEDRLPEP